MTNCLIKSTCHNIQLTEKYTWQYHYIIIMFFNLIRITQKWSWGPEHQPPSHNHNCFFFQTELGASLKKVSKAVLYFVGGILLAVTISLSQPVCESGQPYCCWSGSVLKQIWVWQPTLAAPGHWLCTHIIYYASPWMDSCIMTFSQSPGASVCPWNFSFTCACPATSCLCFN